MTALFHHWWRRLTVALLGFGFCFTLLLESAVGQSDGRTELAPAVVQGHWVRPAVERPVAPVWGHADGLRVGLHPLRGPRGLLRIYAPYLGHEPERMINFIAVEPIPIRSNRRGLSELEHSQLDSVRGKRFWSANEVEDLAPQPSDRPAQGTVETVDGVQCLRVFILIERFENGAHVYLRLTFRADRPHEVGVAAFMHDDSTELSRLIVTATMGNYARLRRLQLADRVVEAGELWPDFRGNDFTPHARFALKELARTADGGVIASATTDEMDPAQAAYAPFTSRHWRYAGKQAVQSWRTVDPHPQLEVLVNGRRVYWGGRSPIPGGISFENFEMAAPFHQGDEYWFGVEPK